MKKFTLATAMCGLVLVLAGSSVIGEKEGTTPVNTVSCSQLADELIEQYSREHQAMAANLASDNPTSVPAGDHEELQRALEQYYDCRELTS